MQDVLRTYKLLTLTKGVNSGRCAMVEGILKALQGTPIPTILVVAGIAFLLLSIVGQLVGRINVPPERQRRAAIIGGLLLVVGLALDIGPSLWRSLKSPEVLTTPRPQPRLETKEPPPAPQRPPSTPSPPASPNPGQEIPTTYDGVMARVTRFGTSGAFISLEIAVKNGGKKDVIVCGSAEYAELFDQQTGEKWEPVNTGGAISGCDWVYVSRESGMWMQFKILDPDKRVFLLKSKLFNQPVENLVLGNSP
jgi:hypothetical protein